MRDACLSVKNLSFDYGPRAILGGASATLRPDELVGLVGPNGAGKSTLVCCILGMLRPKTGRVVLSGRDVQAITAK